MDKQSRFKEFARCAALSVLGTLGVSCYILADTFFVSKGLGTKGLAALNLAIPVYNFIHGTGLMLGMGGATRFSVCKSQGIRIGLFTFFYGQPLYISDDISNLIIRHSIQQLVHPLSVTHILNLLSP